MKELLFENLDWKVFPLSETEYFVITDFLGKNYSQIVNIDLEGWIGELTLSDFQLLKQTLVSEAKRKIVADITIKLFESIDGMESVDRYVKNDEGKLELETISATIEVTK